jgi:REP element-mobilizing transposase RayT
MNELPKRKPNRLINYDYSNEGAYFITICSNEHKYIFSRIVGANCVRPPETALTYIGNVINNEIQRINTIYNDVFVDKYVIMPNHLHLIIQIKNDGGASRTPLPTNSILSSYIGTLKRFINKQIGKSIWQKGYYDHIIRDEDDYLTKCQYIENNPAKWYEDKYYIQP